MTAKPGGVAGANVDNAYSIKKWFIKLAKSNPANYISVPNQVSRIKGGAISTSGGEEYFIKFIS